MARGSKLTTTSYAVLGLLAIRPWTTYEMTRQMQRSLSRFWPRAVSKLYEEPKKLAGHRLADGCDERTGQRTRRRYTITDDGRRELAAWLARPAQDPVLELEFLVKVFLAEHGTKQDLIATLAAVTAWAQQQAVSDAQIAAGYLAGTGPFPERTPQLALVGTFLSDFSELTERWARWATGLVEQWPDDAAERTPAWQALQDIADRGRRPPGQPAGRPAAGRVVPRVSEVTWTSAAPAPASPDVPAPIGTLASVSLDCPDPAVLANFYGALLGMTRVFETPGGSLIALSDGRIAVTMVRTADHVAPGWPEPGRQQLHLDVLVADLEQAVASAVALGATEAASQPAAEVWRVLVDPTGHPFRLTTTTTTAG